MKIQAEAIVSKECFKRAAAVTTGAVVSTLRAVYSVAKVGDPILRISETMKLLKVSGVQVMNGYDNAPSHWEMVEIMAQHFRKLLESEIRDAPCFSLIVDESTDISVTKNLIFYVRYWADDRLQTRFLANVALPDGRADAETIFNAILKRFNAADLSIDKMIGFGSDGASVMVGDTSGVAARLKQLNPNIMNFHCEAHKYNFP